ncbi:MAG: tryptophan-rich sensory protein [Micrococcales bacterium]|nr:tryptophan-rich sensory protein [Micrococcales bacterium]
MTRQPETSARTALVTGATGYIGGLLVPRLLEAGWQVRVLTRRRSALADRSWAGDVDIVEADASSEADLRTALHGIHAAYFLIHSMDGDGDFARRDREMATSFAAAARDCRVRRIVYLGGLHPDGEELSPHLASRVEVGSILLDSGVPTAVLQAAVVLGSGSASFDMLRYLSTRLPAMVAPKWLNNRIQPIAIDDVLRYLVGAAELPEGVNRTFDIGGPQVLTYAEMIQRFVEVVGMRRRAIVTVPVLTPRLASHWVGLVTPIKAGIAKPLVGSLVHEVVCRENDIAAYVPDPDGGLVGVGRAVRPPLAGAAPDPAARNLAMIAGATVLSAVAGSIATQPGSQWYKSLDLPPWQPPKLAFPIVWTALYADIAATSTATVTGLEQDGRQSEATAYRTALAANLVLNTAWSVIYWRARRPGLAASEAGLLTLSSADLARRAGARNPTLGKALAPYAVWCGFATALAAAIARRNR